MSAVNNKRTYKDRLRDRLAGKPPAARPIPPWWITRWTSSRPNPVLHGPFYLLVDKPDAPELPDYEPDAVEG